MYGIVPRCCLITWISSETGFIEQQILSTSPVNTNSAVIAIFYHDNRDTIMTFVYIESFILGTLM